jgi:hypothetical protein
VGTRFTVIVPMFRLHKSEATSPVSSAATPVVKGPELADPTASAQPSGPAVVPSGVTFEAGLTGTGATVSPRTAEPSVASLSAHAAPTVDTQAMNLPIGRSNYMRRNSFPVGPFEPHVPAPPAFQRHSSPAAQPMSTPPLVPPILGHAMASARCERGGDEYGLVAGRMGSLRGLLRIVSCAATDRAGARSCRAVSSRITFANHRLWRDASAAYRNSDRPTTASVADTFGDGDAAACAAGGGSADQSEDRSQNASKHLRD